MRCSRCAPGTAPSPTGGSRWWAARWAAASSRTPWPRSPVWCAREWSSPRSGSDAAENFEHFIRSDDSRGVATRAVLAAHGDPAKEPAFWAGISARTYFGDITEPVLVLHGTADDTCPIAWSRTTVRLMRRAGVDVTLRTYAGEGHAFGPQFGAAMEETGRFLRRQPGLIRRTLLR
ncbi:prolyl oligopeptidase family serine peptidase [Nocardioides convexus]|uniref:alpha/beta hydrolase family protein n=1 Tax=Nocardioides convexus TaxID=2712224 RepID=UPI0024188082|nr:prolyl oligopeptidase family serine peptidase [Nocardioides convexus]